MPIKHSHEEIYLFAKKLALSAAKMIKESVNGKGKGINYECKLSSKDLVTKVDKEVEQLIMGEIKGKYPEHCFVGEESSSMDVEIPSEGYCWIIDPVDGTNNFVHGNTSFCVSIGLCFNGIPVIGCVLNPVTGDFYHAMLGNGAYLNDFLLEKENSSKKLGESLVIIEFTGFGDDLTMENTKNLLKESHGIRIIGSSALDLCNIASHQYDVFFVRGIKSWDICAGVCILREAGGEIENMEGGEFSLLNGDYIASSNPSVIKEVRSLIQ